jgi:hypothetical protein
MRLYTFVIKTEDGHKTETHEAENLIHALFFLSDEDAENVTSISSYEIGNESPNFNVQVQ